MTFADIPEAVIDYVRRVFAAANDRVTRKMSDHPSMHEETLDHALIDELTDAPPAFFAEEQAAVQIEAHWLGGRRMWGRWEIADVAVIVMLRQRGRLAQRKVALLQTKRLYSDEIPVQPLEWDDYAIGIGRLGDRIDPEVPLTRQRLFSFDETSEYGAMSAGSDQVQRIEEYVEKRGIPVFYAFYNPLQLPFQSAYPSLNGARSDALNALGCRVQTMEHVHGHLATLAPGKSPTLGGLGGLKPAVAEAPADHPGDPFGGTGWRIENFIADEVLRCRQGALFDAATNPALRALFYERGAPIQAAINISIEVNGAD